MVAAVTVLFHGTQEESADLVNAIARNCTCKYGLMGVRQETCAPHKGLLEDQRWLDGLLFARYRLASSEPAARSRVILMEPDP